MKGFLSLLFAMNGCIKTGIRKLLVMQPMGKTFSFGTKTLLGLTTIVILVALLAAERSTKLMMAVRRRLIV